MKDTVSQEDQYLFEICPCDHCEKFAIRLLFPVFSVFQATLQLVSARIYKCVVSTWKRFVSTKYRVPRCPEQQKLPHMQLTKIKKNPVHMKSPQAQTKNKSFFNQHRLSQICSCPT